MVDSEDLFIDLAESLLGDDVVSVLRLLLEEGVEMTDDEIASKLNMKVNDVRKRLYSLSEQGFVVSRRTREKEKGWYIYFWKPNLDHINEILMERKRQILNKLQSRLEYESSNTFYICSRDMNRYSFEEAFENEFKCPRCGTPLEYYDSDKVKQFLSEKIKAIEKEINEETKNGTQDS
ncbi:transcription factor [Sulfuracidifex tepidarius]|uniref:Transcription factor E n=2 Tax=Sulfuracidifex tepidarius TaxID=1294262 RepID=A0A510DW35_9CREN|nr:transcription factor [Sulfuracidifex tepidarius]BBG24443.1 Transcription factor E [Sulfuracidifex tepidarius]BBG27201.1 Transcription factor E [Sulfuracidifex tepidarius]